MRKTAPLAPALKAALDRGFNEVFSAAPERYFSAPGRSEIGGNHTDHQHGRVLAAAIDRDTTTAVRLTGGNIVRVYSEGYPICEISLEELSPIEAEQGSSAALLRGVLAGFAGRRSALGGFEAYIRSDVLPGSGLSSSAAFEVLLGTVCNHLFCGGSLSPAEVARIGQRAENEYFGKPCGLMDQMASASGGLIAIDFADPGAPILTPVGFDFSTSGHALCIIDTGADHAGLTGEYTAITDELKTLCSQFGANVLRELPEEEFYARLPALRGSCCDRAILRAIHFYDENTRVAQQAEALSSGDFDTFLQLVRKSGESSWMYLQNVIPAGSTARQDMALALALCHKLLGERGAFRVHGGGFAGTVQAFVPNDMLTGFKSCIESVFGSGSCRIMSIREYGGVELK